MEFQWHQIESFLLTAEKPSFSQAAKSLYVTPSALTQQIASLEASLGFSLFDRTNRGVALTPGGKEFFRAASEAKEVLEEALPLCRKLAGVSRGLRVGSYSDWVWGRLFDNLVRAFSKANPDVEITFVPTNTSEAVERCRRGDFDMFQTADPSLAATCGLETREGVSCAVCAVMSPAHPLASLEKISSADLVGQTVLADLDFCPPAAIRWLVDAGLPEPVDADIDFDRLLESGDDSHVVLFSTNWADMLRPMVSRPLVPRVEYATRFILSPDHSPAAEDFAVFMRGRV